MLAHEIAVFEWLDRKHGFAVHTPRIPGLPYDAIAAELDAYERGRSAERARRR